jgi:hypothetical protein
MNSRLFIFGAIALACLSRIIPHPQNFAPMTAIAIFGAATLKNRRLAFITTLGALFLSDLSIEVMHRLGLMHTWGLYQGMWATYLAYVLVMLIGTLLRDERNVEDIAVATLCGSVVFFVVTNFAVWLGNTDGTYPHTWPGLAECYYKAVPFFRNSLAGDAFFATVLFGGYALVQAWYPATRRAEART